MIDRIETIAFCWGITVDQLRQIAERFGCLGLEGRGVAARLLQDRIDTYAATGETENSPVFNF